jgi:hypothetical protein
MGPDKDKVIETIVNALANGQVVTKLSVSDVFAIDIGDASDLLEELIHSNREYVAIYTLAKEEDDKILFELRSDAGNLFAIAKKDVDYMSSSNYIPLTFHKIESKLVSKSEEIEKII